MDKIDEAFEEWLEHREGNHTLNEAMQTNRYSVEVNYRSKTQEVVDSFAKLVLGYVSAGMKNCGYHTKVMFNDKPYRVLISTRNWDSGEWCGIGTFNHDTGQFIIATGVYHKDKKTVSIHHSKKAGDSAAEIVRELRNLMEELKRTKPFGSNTLEPVDLKRGPKPTHLKKLNNVSGPFKVKKII